MLAYRWGVLGCHQLLPFLILKVRHPRWGVGGGIIPCISAKSTEIRLHICDEITYLPIIIKHFIIFMASKIAHHGMYMFLLSPIGEICQLE